MRYQRFLLHKYTYFYTFHHQAFIHWLLIVIPLWQVEVESTKDFQSYLREYLICHLYGCILICIWSIYFCNSFFVSRYSRAQNFPLKLRLHCVRIWLVGSKFIFDTGTTFGNYKAVFQPKLLLYHILHFLFATILV